MESKVMGFLGVESYDLMLYLARTLGVLGNSVACIDNSDDKSLAWAVPGGVQCGGMQTYQKIDFSSGMDPSKFAGHYDYVMVYCGFNNETSVYPFEEIYLVTDYQLHHLETLRKLKTSPDALRFLIVRERVSTKLKPSFVMEELDNYNFTPDTTFVLEDGQSDLEAKVLCQHVDNFTFNKVSQSVRDFVVQVLSVDYSTKEITAAFKAGSRRF